MTFGCGRKLLFLQITSFLLIYCFTQSLQWTRKVILKFSNLALDKHITLQKKFTYGSLTNITGNRLTYGLKSKKTSHWWERTSQLWNRIFWELSSPPSCLYNPWWRQVCTLLEVSNLFFIAVLGMAVKLRELFLIFTFHSLSLPFHPSFFLSLPFSPPFCLVFEAPWLNLDKGCFVNESIVYWSVRWSVNVTVVWLYIYLLVLLHHSWHTSLSIYAPVKPFTPWNGLMSESIKFFPSVWLISINIEGKEKNNYWYIEFRRNFRIFLSSWLMTSTCLNTSTVALLLASKLLMLI